MPNYTVTFYVSVDLDADDEKEAVEIARSMLLDGERDHVVANVELNHFCQEEE